MLLDSFADQEVIDRLRAAKHVVPFKTMHAPQHQRVYSHNPHAKYFSAIAFGRIVFLWCHMEDDFTLSVAHVLLGGKPSYNLAR